MINAGYFGDIFGHASVQIVATVVVIAVVQLISRQVIIRLVRRLVTSHKYESRTDEIKRENTLIGIFRTATALILWIIGVVVILGELHVNIAALMTGAGVVGVLVGFGAQNSIKDYLAGIFVIAENQYRVGDIVSFYAGGANAAGVVEDISIRITKLRDLDGMLHIVPNGSAGVVTNMSYKFANVNVDVNVRLDADIDKVKEVLNEIGATMAMDPAWKDSTIEPIQFLRVDSLNDSSITVKSVGKVQPATQWNMAGEFRRRIQIAFAKHNIEIPFPQMVVHQPKADKSNTKSV